MSAEAHPIALSAEELSQLASCEAIIKAHKESEPEAAEALRVIIDGQLYRSTHGSQEAYLDDVWDWSLAHGKRLVAFARTRINLMAPAGAMSSKIIPLPTRERQTRAIASASPEVQREVWEASVKRAGGGVPDGEIVRAVAAELRAVDTPQDDPFDDPAAIQAMLDSWVGSPSDRPVEDPPPSAAIKKAMGPPGTTKSGEKTSHNERYTPSKYVEAARRAMGGIDVDPCSCARANRKVQAGTFFGKENDGRKQLWRGRVWLNPAYIADEHSEGTREWVRILLEKFDAGEVTEAVLCVNALPYTDWHQALSARFLVCDTDHRIDFEDGTKPEDAQERGSPSGGTSFFYLGPHREAFAREFRAFGVVKQAFSLSIGA